METLVVVLVAEAEAAVLEYLEVEEAPEKKVEEVAHIEVEAVLEEIAEAVQEGLKEVAKEVKVVDLVKVDLKIEEDVIKRVI